MPEPSGTRRRFTLEEARQLLPTVKRLTAQAVHEADALIARLHNLPEDDPTHVALAARVQQVIAEWARHVTSLDGEVKGLWLVDFDNGEGYYCWCYPEETLSHFHGYEDGFAGRMKIV